MRGGQDPPTAPPSHARRTARNLRQVLRFARPHWRILLASFVLMGIESYAAVGRLVILLPIFQGAIPTEKFGKFGPSGLAERVSALVEPLNAWTSRLVPASWIQDAGPDAVVRLATLLSVAFLFLGFMVVMTAATYGESYCAEAAKLRIVMDVRYALCRVLMSQPVAFFDRQRRGEVVQRLLGDVEGYSTALNLALKEVAKAFFMVLASLTALVLLSWQLSIALLLGVPFLVPLYLMTKRTIRRSHKRQQESARRTEILLQIFSGIRTVKAFGTEERRIDEFRAVDREVSRRALRVQRTKSTADALTELINNVLALVLAIGGGILILRGMLAITIPDLFAYLIIVANLYQPLKRLVKHYNHLQDSSASIERVTEWLNLPQPPRDPPDAVAFPGVRSAIRFEGVGFSYVPGQPVLEDVSFEIPRGGTVALVGPSGAGKSTLCDLLLRFYDAPEGRITVDGADVRTFRRGSYLARTAVVTQTPFLFHASIGENIRQGKPGASDAEVEAAAEAAQIGDFVKSLPRGYDEEVGEAGVRLSGGQRQRITIARALVRDPEILVLDEATSSLDTASERAVQEALDRLREGRTTLVVAHRLSTVRHADRIVVLDQGRVVDQGTHDELVARGGLYAGLVRMQDLAPAAAEGEPA